VLWSLPLVRIDVLAVDLDRPQLLLAVRHLCDHAAPGRRFHLPFRDLVLDGRKLLLQLLRLFHDVAEALHWLSPSGARGRTATTSPPNCPSAACTAGCCSMPPVSSAPRISIRVAPGMCRRTACVTRSRLARPR